jgi:hypothetical protein
VAMKSLLEDGKIVMKFTHHRNQLVVVSDEKH